jgi:predicted MFS family arabinose efflux permease
LLKTFLLIIATEVWHVYLIQLLQTFTYGFINQPLYYFARQRVSQADLVKGQAVAASMYVFGTACGGFAGGRALDAFGLDKMLSIAFVIALTGTIIINVSLFKDKREGLKNEN